MPEQKSLPSGRTLEVSIAPFAAANKLKKVLLAELLAIEVDVGRLDPRKLALDAEILNLDPRLLNTLKNVVCKLLASDAVENAFFECAIRSTIDGQKITRESFDAAEARADYLVAAWEVIRANVAPFFGGLDLRSLIGSDPKNDGPESGSTSTSLGLSRSG